MNLLRISDTVINLDQVAWIDLRHPTSLFGTDTEVRLFFVSDAPTKCSFKGEEAEALRAYFGHESQDPAKRLEYYRGLAAGTEIP